MPPPIPGPEWPIPDPHGRPRESAHWDRWRSISTAKKTPHRWRTDGSEREDCPDLPPAGPPLPVRARDPRGLEEKTPGLPSPYARHRDRAPVEPPIPKRCLSGPRGPYQALPMAPPSSAGPRASRDAAQDPSDGPGTTNVSSCTQQDHQRSVAPRRPEHILKAIPSPRRRDIT